MVAPTQFASDHHVCIRQNRAIIDAGLTRYPGATGTDEGPRKQVIVSEWEIMDE